MSRLPLPIQDFILSLTDDRLSPAYLLVTETGLSEWGGDLEAYGIKDLEQNIDVSDRIVFLAGLFPLSTTSIFLPSVETTSGVYADVYLFNREQGTWVLMLDSTAETARRQNMQQKLYDARLQVSDLEREGDALHNATMILEEKLTERTAELMQTILQLRQQLAEQDRARKLANKVSGGRH